MARETAARPRRAENLEQRLVGEELVRFDIRRGTGACLDLVAWAIWDMCDGQRTTTAIARMLATAVGEERSRVERDVDRVVSQLQESGFLAIDSSGRNR